MKHRSLRADRHRHQRGAVLIWMALGMVLLLGMAAVAIDTGYVDTVRSDLQSAVDASALAGASGIPEGNDEAIDRAIDFAAKNVVNGKGLQITVADVELGNWDPDTRTFTPGVGSGIDAVRVTADLAADEDNGVGLIMAPIVGVDQISMRASAIAYYQPRDIMVALDLSGSMCYDSTFVNIGRIGRDKMLANLEQMWQELGDPRYGDMGFNARYISTSNRSRIKRELGLQYVPYPFPSGSWDDYIDYVRGDRYCRSAGYRYRYGGITLLNYWMYKRSRHSQTPVLAELSAQPITAVKDAVDVFIDYMNENITEDRIGLSVYTSSDDTAKLEHTLTDNYDIIKTIARNRQAGHYDSMTNIGAGIKNAREEMLDNGRPGAFKMIVLMTDGQANLPRNSSYARMYALDQAAICAEANIPILTISLGAGADEDLMGDIAEMTGGVHFNIPGGSDVDAYAEDLKRVFKDVAKHRPLKLVR